MPSTYLPPDVTVKQVRRTGIANNYLPQLPVVVVGPARQIVTRGAAGTYDAGVAFTAGMPQLVAGALTLVPTVEVVLQANDSFNKQLGYFKLDTIDFTVSDDGTSISIDDDIALEYSLLSLRNNPGSLTENDQGTLISESTVFTDKQVDFLSRGATKNADSFIIISSPLSQVGRYRIYDMVPSGTKVNTVKAELVDGNDTAVLTKSFNILHTARPVTPFVYGYPTNHELSATQNVLSGDIGLGVGVKAQIGSTISGAGMTTLFNTAINIPDIDSGDVVVFQPDSTGKALAGWIALIAAAKVGDYFRLQFTHAYSTADLIRDFKIVAIDTTAKSMSLQNEDLTGSGTQAVTSANTAATGSVKILEVLKGSDDATNAAGDVLSGEVSGVPFENEIKRAVPGFVELISVLPTLSASTDTPITMRRGVPFNSNNTVYDLTKKIDSGFTATVLVSYEAQRADLALNGMIELSDLQSIEQNLGVIHPDNAVALMADMVSRSGLPSPNQTFYALVTADETLESFEAAIDELKKHDVYFIIPATQEQAILDVFKNHIDDQSLPQNKHERICLGTTPLITYEQEIPALLTTDFSQGTAASITPKLFVSSAVDWSLAKAGDVLKIMSAANHTTATVLASYRIESVDISGQSCTTLVNIDPAYLTTPQYFKVDTYPFDATAQAEAWRDEASSYLDFRFMMIRPDICEITYTNKSGLAPIDTEVIVPSYYLAALFAGLKATLPPEQPMTNVPLPGVNRLFHSNEYFSPEQLNTIAEGGNAIFTQLTRTSAPVCRHQLMTDMTSLYTREMSIIVLVDFSAKFLRNSLHPYVGNHVISAEYLTQLRGITEALIRALVSNGTLLAGTTLDKLYQNPDQPDEVLIDITLEVPVPCNKISITLYI